MNPANTSEQPVFRTDLVAQPVFDNGQVFVDVTDPDSGKTFRFYDFEYSIACAMDGRRDVNGLISWATDELGLSPSPEELASVISTLGDLGYLGSAAAPMSVHDRPTPAPTPVAAKAGSEVELGLGGATSASRPAPPSAGDVELGAPGKSPIAKPRPTPPKAEDIELGFSGVGDAAAAGDGAAVEADDIEIAPLGAPMGSPAPTPAPGSAEESFAGLMDDEDASERAPTQSTAPLTVDDEDISVDLSPPPTGMPAAEPKPTLRPVTNQGAPEVDEDTHLPPPQVEYDDEDVSVDLSAHLSVGTEDLKEAVRQSKVMTAVSVPDDLMAELDDDQPTKVKPGPEATPPPTPPQQPSAAAAVVAAEAATDSPGASPIELPDKQKKAKKPAKEEPKAATAAEAPAKKPKKTSTGLIVLFVIVLLGGAFAFWWFNLRKEDKPARPRPTTRGVNPTGTKPAVKPDGTKPTGTKPAVKPDGTKPTPAKPAVVFKLEAVSAPGTALKNTEGGVPELVAADGAKVNEGDLLAKVGPWKRGESRITHAKERIEHYQAIIDGKNKKAAEAKAGGNAGLAAKLEREAKSLTKEKIDARRKHVIDKWSARIYIKAPSAGTVKWSVKKGAWVAAGKSLGEIVTQGSTGGSFTAPQGKSFAKGDSVTVALVSDANKKGSCKVMAVEGNKVTVSCAGTSFAAGDELAVQLD